MSRGYDMGQAFRVDAYRDREQASDGVSRFGAYLRDRAGWFADLAGFPAEFAAAALRVALPPVMSPGYVVTHPRVREVGAHWDDEGRWAVEVTVVSQLPPAVAGVCRRWRGWRRERDGFGGAQRWADPYDNDLPAALPLLLLRVPVPVDCLPAPCYRRGAPDPATAARAVTAVVGVLNRAVTPVLQDLDTPRAVA